jgi:hypothetical protein
MGPAPLCRLSHLIAPGDGKGRSLQAAGLTLRICMGAAFLPLIHVIPGQLLSQAAFTVALGDSVSRPDLDARELNT